MKKAKATVKFQLERDGEHYNQVFDRAYEARDYAEKLVSCGFIQTYKVIPVKAVWLKA